MNHCRSSKSGVCVCVGGGGGDVGALNRMLTAQLISAGRFAP